MDGLDYKPNSNKFKEEQKQSTNQEKRANKVVKGAVKVKKKNDMHKIKDAIVSDDAGNIKSYILLDVIIPAIKNTIEDVVINGIRMLLRGETSARSSTRNKNVDYASFSRFAGDSRSTGHSSRAMLGYSYNDLRFETRGEAESVLSGMDEIMDQYHIVRVADFYDLAGVSGNFTDNDYGWTNIQTAKIERMRDGYAIKLPRALSLK